MVLKRACLSRFASRTIPRGVRTIEDQRDRVVQTLVWGCGEQWVIETSVVGPAVPDAVPQNHNVTCTANAGFLDYSQTGNRIGCDNGLMPARDA